MSRSTAEIVADLRGLSDDTAVIRRIRVTLEAADRLTELDALSVEMAKRLWAYSDLRPTCPTCGGGQEILIDEPHHLPDCDCLWDETPCAQTVGPCPDCVDGKVSIEQLAALWRAVWECPIRVSTIADEIEIAKCKGHNALRDRLQSVRP